MVEAGWSSAAGYRRWLPACHAPTVRTSMHETAPPASIDSPPALERRAVDQALRYFQDWLGYRRWYLRIPGVQAAVYVDGELALSVAYGRADVERDVAMTPDHLFRIASHSKTFTSVAVMQLVEAGTLRLDDVAGRWVPSLHDSGSPLADVTVRELLSHSSGVYRDGVDGNFWQLQHGFPDRAELLALLNDPTAAVQPANEAFKYSNVGYGLLGLVLEAATGDDYATVLRRGIVDRLGLHNTGPELDESRLSDYAVGYSALAYAEERVPIEHVDTRAFAAATGFYSTASDLVTYFAAHFYGDEQLITDHSKRAMQLAAWDVRSRAQRYGLGLSVSELGKRRLIGHGGGFPGHITSSIADPVAGLAVSVFTNAVDGPAESLAQAALRLIDLACSSGPSQRRDVDLTRFTGRFATLFGVVDVALLGDRLFLIRPVAVDPVEEVTELSVVDDNTLLVASGPGYGSVGEPLRFAFADDGSITSVRGESATTATPIERFTLPERVRRPRDG
jgi:CubicO group peptidase (beta-lactamase class C family)